MESGSSLDLIARFTCASPSLRSILGLYSTLLVLVIVDMTMDLNFFSMELLFDRDNAFTIASIKFDLFCIVLI